MVDNKLQDSRLITEYYSFTIRVDQVNFLSEKFGPRLIAEIGL